MGIAMLASGPAVAFGAPEAGARATTVDMEAAARAAQIDPQRDDQSLTPGAKPSVEAIENALNAEGLLDQQHVDGHYGTKTVAAYTEYQESLGYVGIGANGIPGAASLRELGTGRFDVSRIVLPGERTEHTGKVVNARTEEMLAHAQQQLDRELVLDQGSYNPGGDPTSAGTHDGGGAVDINTDDMDEQTARSVVEELRKVGFAAWYRTPDQGDWPHHIHAIALSDPDLSSPAQEQAGDYYLGKNGLANEQPDDGPEVKPIRTWEQYQRAAR